jgi:hypothetical protein
MGGLSYKNVGYLNFITKYMGYIIKKVIFYDD